MKPGFAALLVGNNPASLLYISRKEKIAKELGVYFENIHFPETASDGEIIQTIKALNANSSIHGILLQMPLPGRSSLENIIKSIDHKKDIDGFLPESGIDSPTVQAIISGLKLASITLAGKKAALLVNNEAFFQGIREAVEKEGIEVIDEAIRADIVIVAKGMPGYLSASMIKKGAIVIDVGINMIGGKTVGDSNPDIAEKASFLSPAPGGVGPLTIAYLFENLICLAKKVL